MDETEIIRRFFARGSQREDVTLAIGDDAAAVRVPERHELVSAMDTLVADVHFPAAMAAHEIGHRTLAVNLSDFAAMAAQPAWALLSLSLPQADESWLQSFSDGFFELADEYDVALIGGDLVSGPLAATVTLLGHAPQGSLIRRSGARAGDALYVTGRPGAALASDYLRRPEPRVVEGLSLRGVASAMIDISDGLLTDTRRLAESSGVCITLDAGALAEVVEGDLLAAICGGDDYELLFTAPEGQTAAVTGIGADRGCGVRRIGQVGEGQGVVLPGHDPDRLAGYDHFSKT
ncbi:MAG: thiamine-phosphate kinase [Gammaproteobacteria bacterium]|nr:thiamine-phosphate kinase [Gammaproteobacteria bacterium]NNF59964.1 thiamine-phosphate kinase [Gammaproteobacteria bacterium]NNM19672.1 thiamine-phosphate kinase [Gammaproteobacteria bacterium]